MTANGTLKVADFGLARETYHSVYKKTTKVGSHARNHKLPVMKLALSTSIHNFIDKACIIIYIIMYVIVYMCIIPSVLVCVIMYILYMYVF